MARKISESSADGDRRVVLVVEDEPLIALHLQSILEDNGYNVLGPVGTVGEALPCGFWPVNSLIWRSLMRTCTDTRWSQ